MVHVRGDSKAFYSDRLFRDVVGHIEGVTLPLQRLPRRLRVAQFLYIKKQVFLFNVISISHSVTSSYHRRSTLMPKPSPLSRFQGLSLRDGSEDMAVTRSMAREQQSASSRRPTRQTRRPAGNRLPNANQRPAQAGPSNDRGDESEVCQQL